MDNYPPAAGSIIYQVTGDTGVADEILAKLTAANLRIVPKLTVVQDSGGEWEALYDQDGAMVHQGHSVVERVYERAGIEVIYDEGDLLQGASGRRTSEACAPTLAELDARRRERLAKANQALHLRQEAQKLLDEAGTIDGRPLVVAHKDDLQRGTKTDKWVKS